MKRLLPLAIAATVVVIAGCGSGGAPTTKASTKATTSTTKATTSTTVATTTTKPKPRHKPKPKPKVTTTTHTTATTTHTTTPPPPVTTHTTTVAPPPTTTHTVTHTHTHTHTTAPPPVTTHQSGGGGGGGGGGGHHHHHGGGGGGQGYCLSVTTEIETPNGSVPVADVRPGMSVWSTDLQGRRISVRVLRVRQAHVPSNHLMVRLRLADGRHLLVSLTHPLPDGALAQTLAAGGRFEGTRVVSAAHVVYGRPYTYDLLPAGPTHTYYADGMLMGSTLAPAGTYLSRPF